MRHSSASRLTRIPARAPHIRWQCDSDRVTLQVENTGWANRLAQALFRRPRYSWVQLDVLGSYVWQQLDGRQTVQALGQMLETRFGAAAEPVYDRLVYYLQILHQYGFIQWA